MIEGMHFFQVRIYSLNSGSGLDGCDKWIQLGQYLDKHQWTGAHPVEDHEHLDPIYRHHEQTIV